MGSFANRLRYAMEKQGMTKAELSRKSGIADASISRYCSGQVLAKQDKVYLLAKALNVNPTWLMGFEDPEMTADIRQSLTSLIATLSPEQQEDVVDYIRYLKSKNKE